MRLLETCMLTWTHSIEISLIILLLVLTVEHLQDYGLIGLVALFPDFMGLFKLLLCLLVVTRKLYLLSEAVLKRVI